MTPTDYASYELALWQGALSEQRELEDDVNAARKCGDWVRVVELRAELEGQRTRADLLLAEAVKVKCTFRDHQFSAADLEPTQPDALRDSDTAP